MTAPRTYAQRAAELAEVEAEHAALDARLRAEGEASGRVTALDLVPLSALRDRIRRLRPYALRWRVTGGDARAPFVSVETFDAAEDCVLLGAHAIIDRRDPVALRADVTETTTSHEGGWRNREADHRAAVERLCDANGWEGATIERAGERWEP